MCSPLGWNNDISSLNQEGAGQGESDGSKDAGITGP